MRLLLKFQENLDEVFSCAITKHHTVKYYPSRCWSRLNVLKVADTPQARPNRAVLWLLGADGIQANQATPDGVTPPFIACQNGHVDVVRALLGADGIQANQANL